MYEIIIFYLASLAIGIAFFPFCSRLFSNLEDYGYLFSRVLGSLFLTYIFWIFKHININDTLITILFSIIVIIGLTFFVQKKYYKKFDLVTLIIELILLSLFMSFLLFRSINPRIEGIEKIMDLALINSLAKTNSFPAKDVWYLTKNINYYYFGQLTPAVFMKFLNLSPSIFYNTYISYLFALVGTASFSIGYNLTKKLKYGFLLMFFIAFAGNLDLISKKIQLQQNYYYAEARSLIEYSITEFPSYSFLISDLHAHILNITNVLLIITLLIAIFTTKKINNLAIVILSFVLGISFVTNSWDYIVYTPLSMLVLNLKIYLDYKGNILKSVKKIFVHNLMLILPSLIMFLPFHLNFEPAVSGFGWNKKFDGFKPILLMFGSFLIYTIPFIVTNKLTDYKKTKVALISIFTVWGYMLIIAPQIAFLKDIYFTANPPFYKANTVFKIWYQAWIILSISSTFAIYYTNQKFSNKLVKGVLNTLFLITIVVTAIYPINGVYYLYRTNSETRFKTVEGYSFLNKELPNEYKAIEWLNENYKNQLNLVEKPGDAYTTDSLFSAFTGNPTLVGWSNHQFGWRGNWDEIAKIIGDIDTIYSSSSTQQVNELLEKYNIQLVVIGQKEKDKYGANVGQAVLQIGKIIYENPGVKIVSIE